MARILLAEDDSSMRHFLGMALGRAGHEVIPCRNGLEALGVLEDDRGIELLLTDIVMPGMDGIELSQKAMALREDIKVMFITGFAAVAIGNRNAKNTGARVLSKPFHLKDLVSQVGDLLAA
ncbi:MAG: response regulator [Alphaproteobacteria bacterium]|nr:response regulator [Alphaproteobacteria bacterium]